MSIAILVSLFKWASCSLSLVVISSCQYTIAGQWRSQWFQRSRPTRGGTVRQQTTPANRVYYYLDSLLFVSAFFSASGQFTAAELILNSATKPLRRRPDRTQLLLLLMARDKHPNPGPTDKYPCPVCVRYVTSRGVSYRCTRCSGWVHAKCFGLLNAAQYRRNKDWTCANGIGNKLIELEVVLERNKVKVVVIQESKLSLKSKNPCTPLHHST